MMRAYRPQDLPTLTDIGNRAWRGIYRMYRELYGEELFATLVPDPATVKGEQVRLHCEHSPDATLVCEEDGRIVGFVTFSLNREKSIGVIGNNAVDPECGLKGIGQQMYQAAFDRFRREGLRYAQVTTGLDDAHARARRAYERAGFNVQRHDVTYFRKL